MPEGQKIQWRRGTAAAWTAANPVLSDGTPGYESDTGKFKVGDGTKDWKTLAYQGVSTLAALTDVTPVGKALATATDAAAARTALGVTPMVADARVALAGKPNGALTAFDTGQPVINFGNCPISVAGGELVHTPGPANSAGYIEVDMGKPVTYMRAEVCWPNETSPSPASVTFVVASAQWNIGSGAKALPAAGIHLVVYPNGIWHVSRWTGSSETFYDDSAASGRFTSVRDGQWRELAMWIDHKAGTVLIKFPDGSTHTSTSPFITSECGNFAVFELFGSTGSEKPAKFRDLAVGTAVTTPDSVFVPKADLGVMLGGLKSKVTTYKTPGQYAIQVPPNALGAFVTLVAGGCGGGSGRRGAAGSVRCGGGSGGGGGIINAYWFPKEALGESGAVVVGDGGAGGVAATADNTDGHDGKAGGLTTFTTGSAYLRALPGSGGKGGTATAGVMGTPGYPNGVNGANAATTGGVGGNGGTSGNGGVGISGAGGGITAADVASNGGSGGVSLLFSTQTVGGTAGVVGGAVPGAGVAAVSSRPGDGAGGGAASITAAAQAGATAAGYGVGGGGGGASLNGNDSGAGGKGGGGYAEVVFVTL